MIGKESNIVVIRGGNDHGRPVYQQMVHAVEEFFPESGIVNEAGDVVDEPRASTSSERPYPLRRIETGISSIVGTNNGDRPGGFVLVIDGTALGHVSWIVYCILEPTRADALCRRWQMSRTKASCSDLRCCVRV